MYPLGGILSPFQIVIFEFNSFFTDSGKYKAQIEINMNHHDELLIVPIFFRIDGIPIIFNPPLKDNLDFGALYFQKAPLQLPVSIKNYGSKLYNIKFTKINPNRFESELNSL